MLHRRRSSESQARIFTALGMVFTACLAVALAVFAFANPFGGRPSNAFQVVIETPYVGQGVGAGTALLMHGVEVGKVTHVAYRRGGGIRLTADLQRGPTAGLTNTAVMSFVSANYFGVAGIDVQPGPGGQALTSGSVIKTTPTGNFTLQTMLTRLSAISHGVVTPQLVDVLQRATRYMDGMNPLFETMSVVATSLTDVQTISTARLLTNGAGISAALPGFVNATVSLADHTLHSGVDGVSEDYYLNVVKESFALSPQLFARTGKLESSHSTELAPMVDMIKQLTDIIPGIVPTEAVLDTAGELRSRLQRMFSGPPDQRAVNVRVILDSLPGVAAPIDAVGGAPQ